MEPFNFHISWLIKFGWFSLFYYEVSRELDRCFLKLSRISKSFFRSILYCSSWSGFYLPYTYVKVLHEAVILLHIILQSIGDMLLHKTCFVCISFYLLYTLYNMFFSDIERLLLKLVYIIQYVCMKTCVLYMFEHEQKTIYKI